MEIQESREGDVHIFRLSGKLDSKTSPDFDKRLIAAIENGATRFIIDFEKLDYISSAGLRVLNKATKKLKGKEGKIILCHMVDYIREIFEIAGFDTFLPIAANQKRAFEMLD